MVTLLIIGARLMRLSSIIDFNLEVGRSLRQFNTAISGIDK